MAEVICKICYVVFEATHFAAAYCSDVCRARVAANRSLKAYHDRKQGVENPNTRFRACLECGSEFNERRGSKFCSQKCYLRCYHQSNKEVKPDRNCDQCGELLDPTRKRFCNSACSNRHFRRNNAVALRERKRSTIERDMLQRTKARAKAKGIPFNLTIDDIILPEVCPILGITLEPNIAIGSKGPQNSSPSIDKILPELGYVKGNVRVISYRANLLKSNATLDEMEKVVADLRKISGVSDHPTDMLSLSLATSSPANDTATRTRRNTRSPS